MTAKFDENLSRFEYQLDSKIQKASRVIESRRSKTSKSRWSQRIRCRKNIK